jgi:multidrug efflux pump subunit AcrA (membrane-fusion protein)
MAAVGLIALGAIGTMVLLRSEGILPAKLVGSVAAPPAAEPLPTTALAAVEATNDTEVEVVLPPEAVVQAGIKTAQVNVIEPRLSIEVPGVVMANAYREVKVTPLVGGMVRKVHAELGMAVKRGAPLATLFSSELAEAQTKYLSMQAMLEADH